MDEIIDLARGAEDSIDRGVDPRELPPEQRALSLRIAGKARGDELAFVLRRRSFDDLQAHII
ncbi:MAG: hypothetical protein QM831_10170 [Kofleriaceae bacterium]